LRAIGNQLGPLNPFELLANKLARAKRISDDTRWSLWKQHFYNIA
jgi:hypothetical protein